MSQTVQGRLNDYVCDVVTTSNTPAATYAAWCTELGVSSSATLYALDGDDGAVAVDFAAAPIPGGVAAGFYTYEGGVGWYMQNPTGGSVPTNLASQYVDRFYQLTPSADVALSFHIQQDNKSRGVKFQRSGTTTIIYGRHQRLSSPDATPESYIDFALRVNGSSGFQLEVQTYDRSLDVRLFAFGAFPGSAGVTIATVDFAQKVSITGAPVAPTDRVAIPLVTMQCIAQADVATNTTVKAPVLTQFILDAYNGGQYKISGTVKEAGTPDTPVQRRVRLYVKRTGALIRDMWSASDGAYSFNNLANQMYYVTSFDHTGNYNAVIKDSIMPEVMS